jgi:hypothetical protein
MVSFFGRGRSRVMGCGVWGVGCGEKCGLDTFLGFFSEV